MAIKPFVAVHAGAGYHSISKESVYKKTCKNACRIGIKSLKDNTSAVDAVVSVLSALEDATCTNAGIGSNLTLNGTVECDASVMDGKTRAYGAVGAVSGLRNPVCIAKNIIDTQLKGLSLGRIPPSILVGRGAYDWAIKQGFNHVSDNVLITEASQKTYENYKQKLVKLENRLHCKSKRKCFGDKVAINHEKDSSLNIEEVEKHNDISQHQDTVGAVCVDDQGNIACAVSSGGLSLKQPGRLGSAAVFGAGCWAANNTVGSGGIGVVTSGTGEHLVRTNFAKEFAECVLSEEDTTLAVNKAFDLKFFGSPLLNNVRDKFAGVLLVKLAEVNEIELVSAHCTSSMCVGYAIDGNEPKAYISRLSPSQKPGKSLNIQGKHFFL
ncbi:threonine aspartase 1-like [Argonauta hians]